MNLGLRHKRTYLDFAASTPASKKAWAAFSYAARQYGNPSSPHTEGREARTILEDARARIAALAEVKPDAVVFTSGATESNALAIKGHVAALHEAGRSYESMHILYLAGGHASTVYAVEELGRMGCAIKSIPLLNGAIDLLKTAALVRPETVLVVVDAVCGETGMQFAVRDVRRILDKAKSGALLHVDASQLPRVGPFELTRLGADTLALDAQKVGGVRGIGALIAPRRVPLSALVQGGGQERGLRPGTENAALATAFATALEEVHSVRDVFAARAVHARAMLLAEISELGGVAVNEGRAQAPAVLNISLLGRDTDYLLSLLDVAGFAVSTRSACEVDSVGSRAVLALTGDSLRAASTLRISWGAGTHESELRQFSCALIRAVKFLDSTDILRT